MNEFEILKAENEFEAIIRSFVAYRFKSTFILFFTCYVSFFTEMKLRSLNESTWKYAIAYNFVASQLLFIAMTQNKLYKCRNSLLVFGWSFLVAVILSFIMHRVQGRNELLILFVCFVMVVMVLGVAQLLHLWSLRNIRADDRMVNVRMTEWTTRIELLI